MRIFFSNSVYSLITKVDIVLSRGNVNQALSLVHGFVERIITEPLCTAQVFASRELDRLCLRIGRQNLGCIDQPFKGSDCTERSSEPCIVYIVSRLQNSGGHLRLIQDFIQAQPLGKRQLILSTGVGGPSDEIHLTKVFSSDKNVRFLAAPRGCFQSRLTWLQTMLTASQPEHVYLFNHHQDSVAVAALVPELGFKASFCHHGDHHLCLGVHLDHLVHLDLHPMGYHYCREELGVDNRYLPLTFEDNQYVPQHTGFEIGAGLTTATAARSNKVEIPYYVSYVDTIPEVLKRTGGQHIHIGKLTPWALFRIRSRMRHLGIAKNRLVYIEWTSSVWRTLQEYKVDVYLASFPYGAGLTLIEAMGAGIPVIMHQHMYSRVLSGLELAYPEAFSWADPEELLTHLATIEPVRLKHERRLSRQRYEQFHHPEILRSYLREPSSMHLPIPALASQFRPRYDEWASWAEKQLSFYHLVYRFIYRTLRRIRSVFS